MFDNLYHPDFNLYNLCKIHRSLPYGGGVANQPAGLMEKWVLIENTLQAKRKLEGGE